MGMKNYNQCTREHLIMGEVSTDRTAAQEQKTEDGITYGIDDVPPWYYAILLAFQQYMTMFGATISVPFILAGPLCISDNNLAISEIISTVFFVSGIATLIQTTVGNRLPIVQGATFSFLGPTIALLQLEEFKCPTVANSIDGMVSKNITLRPHDWKIGMREIQGAIAVSSIFQVIIGFSGAVGFLLQFIGPLTIAPTVCLVGLSLANATSMFAGNQWGISALTVACVILFSQVLSRRFKIFGLFPVIFAIFVSWTVSAILTATDTFPVGSPARTDQRLDVLQQANWIRFPYPGQWGTPTVSAAGVFGMLAGVIASMIESIGDYYACARLSEAPPPPKHAVNRGIGCEGIGCLIAGLLGSGNGTTSYSENVAAIGITKVASRRVIQIGAVIMILLSVLGKFGAVFTLIPDPIMGGMFWCLFGLISAVGLSNLQFVNLNSSRNLLVLGFSLFNGLVVPAWFSSTTNNKAISTGVKELDQIIIVLLKTNMLVGGVTAAILDNLLPGSIEDRGIRKWREFSSSDENLTESKEQLKTYDLPLVQPYLNQLMCVKYIPFLPYHQQIHSANDFEMDSVTNAV